MTNNPNTSGNALNISGDDIDQAACRIAEMWNNYNTQRRTALALNEETRRFVFATDIEQTSANILPHKNRTHQPKLTSLSDTLQTQYYEASLSMPDFFQFNGNKPEDRSKARKIEAWLRSKLEMKKFRETVGRELLADYVNYGNCFINVDYVQEVDEDNNVLFRGPVFRRISPLDIVINPAAKSIKDSVKIERRLIHMADLLELPARYPNANFNEAAVRKCATVRTPSQMDDWIEVLKKRGLEMDGFGTWNDYFKQDMVELLIYRGDIYNPDTMSSSRNRIVYVVDRTFVIRDAPNTSPRGYDGVHGAGWRVRNDNLWAQGPLDNLVGMQYRIDHLENLKADVFDLIAHPVIAIQGNVDEPETGYAPGAVYIGDENSKIAMLTPDTTALQADTQIEIYHRLMEEFAGAPPESRGIRTPGEKTAFEVSKLDGNAAMMFVDKVRNFERMLEGALQEAYLLMLQNYDGQDYVELFNDIKGEMDLRQLADEEVSAQGRFVAMGARYWVRRNRQTMELNQFAQFAAMDPQIGAHVSKLSLAEAMSRRLNIEDENIVVPYEGAREAARSQAILQSETQRLQSETGQALTDETGMAQPMEPGGTPAGLSA